MAGGASLSKHPVSPPKRKRKRERREREREKGREREGGRGEHIFFGAVIQVISNPLVIFKNTR